MLNIAVWLFSLTNLGVKGQNPTPTFTTCLKCDSGTKFLIIFMDTNLDFQQSTTTKASTVQINYNSPFAVAPKMVVSLHLLDTFVQNGQILSYQISYSTATTRGTIDMTKFDQTRLFGILIGYLAFNRPDFQSDQMNIDTGAAKIAPFFMDHTFNLNPAMTTTTYYLGSFFLSMKFTTAQIDIIMGVDTIIRTTTQVKWRINGKQVGGAIMQINTLRMCYLAIDDATHDNVEEPLQAIRFRFIGHITATTAPYTSTLGFARPFRLRSGIFGLSYMDLMIVNVRARCQLTNGRQNIVCQTWLISEIDMLFAQVVSCSRKQCPDGFIFVSATDTCQPCHFSCATCEGLNADTCLTCPVGANRGGLVGGTCPCAPGFFQFGVIICTCHYSCKTCNGMTQNTCLTCETGVNRGPMVDNLCPCLPGFFDTGVSTCSPCHYSCKTCSGITKNNCVTCENPTNHRTLNGNLCLCDDGFFDSGTAVCAPCHYSCKTCDGGAINSCVTCEQGGNRAGLIEDECPCAPSFYDVGTNVCAACHYSCKTCTGTANTDCLSCDTGVNRRVLIGNQCVCETGVVDSGVAMCSCHYSCRTCTGITSDTCLSCYCTLQWGPMVGNSCTCAPGYYDPGDVGCQPCHHSCKTCSGGFSNNCLSCEVGIQRNVLNGASECPCIGGFQDKGFAICKACTRPKSITCVQSTQTNYVLH